MLNFAIKSHFLNEMNKRLIIILFKSKDKKNLKNSHLIFVFNVTCIKFMQKHFK